MSQIGAHTDVFALGAIAYRALTGVPAFPSRNPTAAIYEALTLHPPPPTQLQPALPEDVDVVLALALAKRPDERYQRASELARDLEIACAGALPTQVCARAGELTDAPAERTFTDPAGYTEPS